MTMLFSMCFVFFFFLDSFSVNCDQRCLFAVFVNILVPSQCFLYFEQIFAGSSNVNQLTIHKMVKFEASMEVSTWQLCHFREQQFYLLKKQEEPWRFAKIEIHSNSLGKCNIRQISVNLKKQYSAKLFFCTRRAFIIFNSWESKKRVYCTTQT